MSANPNFMMVVDHLVEAPKRGTLAKGHVEGGIVNVGDAIQVGNGRLGPTVAVGQISLGGEVVQQASPGDEAVLLLVGLSSSDIHPGDRLIPGREGEVIRSPEEQAWLKLPERIYPIHHSGDFVKNLAWLIFLAIFWIVPVLSFTFHLNISFNVSPWIFFIIWYGILGYGTYRVMRGFTRSLSGRSVFQAGNAPTTARIMNRRVESNHQEKSISYTHHLQVEFNPDQINFSYETQRYELTISKKLYQRLARADYVPVTYATQNPQIFVIEGE